MKLKKKLKKEFRCFVKWYVRLCKAYKRTFSLFFFLSGFVNFFYSNLFVQICLFVSWLSYGIGYQIPQNICKYLKNKIKGLKEAST